MNAQDFKQLLKESRISQTALAREIGHSRNTVLNWTRTGVPKLKWPGVAEAIRRMQERAGK